MAIPSNAQTSNQVVRDALAEIPLDRGAHSGDDLFPEIPIEAERVSHVTTVEHALELDDLRGMGGLFKTVAFKEGALAEVTVVERGQKSEMDSREIEAAGARGTDLQAQRAAIHREDVIDAQEYREMLMAGTAANFAAAHTDDAINFAAAGILTIFEAAAEAILNDGGFSPYSFGRFLIGSTVYQYLRDNPDIKEFAGVGQVSGARISEDTLAAFFGLPAGAVKVYRFSRKIGVNATTQTKFWSATSALLYVSRPTLSDRTFGARIMVPYGAEFGRDGVSVDVRTADMPGIERMREVGACKRYRPLILNDELAFLWTNVANV